MFEVNWHSTKYKINKIINLLIPKGSNWISWRSSFKLTKNQYNSGQIQKKSLLTIREYKEQLMCNHVNM